MDATTRVKLTLGEMVFQMSILEATVEAQGAAMAEKDKRIAELEAQLPKPEPAPTDAA